MSAALLVVDGDVVTMGPDRAVLERTTVAVVDGAIAALGTAAELRAAYPGAEEIDAAGCVVTPGLVDAHQHTTGDPLIRSTIPDDIDAQQAIFDWAVPIHAGHEPGDDELSATLTAVEALTNGVTTIAEPGTVAHPLSVARGLSAAGIRARVGMWGWDTPGLPWSAPVAEVVGRQEQLLADLPPGGVVGAWVTLVGHDLASDELFAAAADLAERAGTQVTWHLSPSDADGLAYAARSGKRPVTHLADLGVLGPRLVLGHGVHLDDDELATLLDTGTAIAVCPGAYLRLGQGYVTASRHAEFLRAGGRLALGCDSHNAGDTPDVLRAAWLLAGVSRDTRAGAPPLTAADAFAVATRTGAEALGLGDVVGSIEVGKRADLVVFDGTAPAWTPRGDLALQLVWGAPSGTVRDVLVDGRPVVRDGSVTTVDLPALREEAAGRRAALLRRAGIDAPTSWPVRSALVPGGPRT
ncbi:amidohydrolase family protein [Blastococcus sp. URHD0036]|uniref:amidohydrolase family protein n=1 Tax=Blastococcus sp. URHD0036 TaxID=1380356 RepID=UPI000A9359CB|nr:amidohydrolase family protein [Blastococcus sp. URHD0036]